MFKTEVRGHIKRELITELSDGDVHSMLELSAGRLRISVDSAIKRLERDGLVTTWVDNFNRPRRRRMVQLTKSALATIRKHTR